MKSFFFICLTNCLDFGILEKYLKCFSQERKVDRYKLIFLFLFCTITTIVRKTCIKIQLSIYYVVSTI